MPSDPKPKIPASALHDLLSSTLKRQHMLSNVPPALRFMPIAALAAEKAIQQRLGLGKNAVEDALLEGAEPERGFKLLPSEVEVLESVGAEQAVDIRRLWSCGVCHDMRERGWASGSVLCASHWNLKGDSMLQIPPASYKFVGGSWKEMRSIQMHKND